jgi:hypothetical protein
LCCPSAATLFGQHLPQQGVAIQFQILPSVSRDWLHDPPLSHFGRLACGATPALSLCCFSCICSLKVQHWEFSILPHPHSLGQVQCSTPTSTVGVRLQFPVYDFEFCWAGGGSVCPGTEMDYVPGEWGVMCYGWCSPVHSADSSKQLWNELAGRNGMV